MIDVRPLDPERCYRASQSRDARFDGWFYVAVRTTGIYCRPSCPAMTPKRDNVEFHPSAAAAQQHGFRACKRCRPDATPGSPEWNVRSDLVARAMRLIADGVVDRGGVAELAGRLGYSERHLNRLITEELGAGPLALARAQRAQTARTLIETTDLSMTDIAHAAGFGSVRQFNDTVRHVYASTPGDLRRHARRARSSDAGTVAVRLPARRPFAGRHVLQFLGERAVPGVEAWDGHRYVRSLDLPHGHGLVTITAAEDGVDAVLRLADWRDLAPAVGRVRRLADLDADPVAVDGALGADPALRPLVAAMPGLRVAGSVDPYETLIRAVIGQQVSVAGARTVTGRIVDSVATRSSIEDPCITHVFPTMERLAEAPDDVFPMPAARAATIRRVAAAAADDQLVLDPGIDRDAIVDELCAIDGIGPWTAAYVLVRGLGDPDVFLSTDLGVSRAADRLGIRLEDAERWRPWRSYAMHHLWATL